MKRMFKGKKRSIVRFCIFNFVFYSVIVLLLFLVLNSLVIQKLNRTFPSINNILEYRAELENDDFSSIPKNEYENCGFLVFDIEGNLLFTTDEDLSESVTGDDIWLINSYDSGTHYQVSQVELNDGSMGYFVTLNFRDKSDGTEELLGFSLLDGNYNIIYGDLFENSEKLTYKEFEFINGNYNEKKEVVKYDYYNSQSDYRTLVFVSNLFTEQAYGEAVSQANLIWIAAFPVLGICIAIQVFLFRRDIKRSIMPIEKAITAYGEQKDPDLNLEDIPSEFKNTASKFLEMHKNLEQEKAEKEEAYGEIRRLMTDISHDIKTPITVIQGYAQAFLNGKIPDEEREKYAEMIYRKSNDAVKLMESLFEYIRMEHPQYSVSLSDVDICEYTREYLAERYEEILNKEFELELDIPEEKIVCRIDELLFARVYDNLVNNILRYNPPGTCIYFSVKKSENKVLIEVGDNGKGIPENLRDKIFRPYVTENSARTGGGGTGLGLSIAKKITELHGGNITLHEKPPKGIKTLFTIELNQKEKG